MKHIFLLLTAATVFFAACKDDDDNNNGMTVTTNDRTFMTNAAYANNNEIDFAQLAISKSANDSVLLFAQQMITDHTMSRNQLDSLGTIYSVALPATIDSAHAVLRTQLAAMTGRMFDSAYIHGQIMDHQNAIALYQSETTNGNNQSIKSYANSTLPHLQMHLMLADSVAAHLR